MPCINRRLWRLRETRRPLPRRNCSGHRCGAFAECRPLQRIPSWVRVSHEAIALSGALLHTEGVALRRIPPMGTLVSRQPPSGAAPSAAPEPAPAASVRCLGALAARWCAEHPTGADRPPSCGMATAVRPGSRRIIQPGSKWSTLCPHMGHPVLLIMDSSLENLARCGLDHESTCCDLCSNASLSRIGDT